MRVDTAEDDWRVEIAIGVDGTARAVETSRRVHEAIHTLCAARGARRAARGVPLAKVQVTVAHVDESTMRGVAG